VRRKNQNTHPYKTRVGHPQLHAATELRVLASQPGNQLEALRGDRKGQHSIRINQQWRICFVSRAGHCYDVEIVDYHS